MAIRWCWIRGMSDTVTACGIEPAKTSVTTGRNLVRCPACLAEMAPRAESEPRYDPFSDDAPIAPTCEPDEECLACQ